MHRKLKVVILLVSVITLQLAVPVQRGGADALQPVVLQLRWDHQFQFAGYYAAQWMGYYAEEGLDVRIDSAFKNGDILDAAVEVNDGRAHFGVGAANLLIAQDSGMQLRLVASIFQRSAVDYCTLQLDQANSVFALSQMNIARRPGDLMDLELQALFYNEGIPPYAKKTTDIAGDFTLEDLTSGAYDVVPEFLGQISYEAERRGVPVKVIHPAAYGIDFYGDTLFTSETLAKSNPDLVERFRRASIKGWQYALENPEAITERIVESFMNTGGSDSREERMSFNRFQAQKVLELTHYPIVQIGNINPSRWGKMASTMKSLEMIQEDPVIEDMIFDYDMVRMNRLQETRKNIAIGLGVLIGCITLCFLAYLKWRNSLLQNEIVVRQTAERQLTLSNSRYETIFRSSVLGITITDYEGRIHHVNDAWCRMTGYPAKDLCTMNIRDLIAPESSGLDDEQLEALRDGSISSYSMEKKYRRQPAGPEDRDFFYGKMVLTQIWDMATDAYLTMSMVTDITRDVLAQEAVSRSEERFRRIVSQVVRSIGSTGHSPSLVEELALPLNLEAINLELERLFTHELEENRRKDALIRYQSRMAAMGEMIGNIAHQWRQPLNTLKLVLLNLKESGGDPVYADKAFAKANALIRRMSDTIDDFRNFSRPLKDPAAFTAAEALKGVLSLLDEQLRMAGISVQADFARMPPLYGLENQLSHVLFNLLSNASDALKQLPPGLPRIIRLTGEAVDQEIVLTVADSGPGVPPEHADRIFEMYFTTKGDEGGTGLGLYMARAILESAFNGRIALAAAQEGCCFEIRIPVDERG